METNNKLREALDEILDRIDTWRTDGSMEHWQYSQLFDIADAALAEPVKNCEVGTAEEQAMRYIQFCYAQMKRNNHCCGPCPCHEFVNGEAQPCTLLWAQLPYEEGGDK